MSDDANIPPQGDEGWTSEKLYEMANALERYIDDPSALGDLSFLPDGIRRRFIEVNRESRITYIALLRDCADKTAKAEAEPQRTNARLSIQNAALSADFIWEEAEPIYREMAEKGQITWVEFLRLSAEFTKLRPK
jgi:hypothetical protein